MTEDARSWFNPIAVEFNGQKKTNIIFVALIITIISGFFLLFLLTPSSSAQDADNVNAFELINLTNQERTNRHLATLAVNPLLNKAAEKKLADLFKHQYFSHNSPDGTKFSTWVKEVGYSYTIVGENLAMGFGTDEQIIKAWMDSPKHRENILKERYQEIGMAIAKGKFKGDYVTMVVQYFGATNVYSLSELLIPYQSLPLDLIDEILVKA